MCNDVHLHNFRAGIDEEKITIFLKIKATMEMFQQKHREQHDWNDTTRQCCGSASINMGIRIQDPKNVHMDPDQDPKG